MTHDHDDRFAPARELMTRQQRRLREMMLCFIESSEHRLTEAQARELLNGYRAVVIAHAEVDRDAIDDRSKQLAENLQTLAREYFDLLCSFLVTGCPPSSPGDRDRANTTSATTTGESS